MFQVLAALDKTFRKIGSIKEAKSRSTSSLKSSYNDFSDTEAHLESSSELRMNKDCNNSDISDLQETQDNVLASKQTGEHSFTQTIKRSNVIHRELSSTLLNQPKSKSVQRTDKYRENADLNMIQTEFGASEADISGIEQIIDEEHSFHTGKQSIHQHKFS